MEQSIGYAKWAQNIRMMEYSMEGGTEYAVCKIETEYSHVMMKYSMGHGVKYGVWNRVSHTTWKL